MSDDAQNIDAPVSRTPVDTEWHRWAPIGQTLDTSGVPSRAPAASIAEFQLLPLEPMTLPEEPRVGEVDSSECYACPPSPRTIWHDDLWQVRRVGAVTGLPFVGQILPRDHVLLENAPLEVMSALGPVLQRVSQAVKSIPAVGRAHFSRWNDGGAHLHIWVYSRPLGMMQGRGAILPYWEQAMPAMPEEMHQRYVRMVAESLAAGGGKAFPTPDAGD